MLSEVNGTVIKNCHVSDDNLAPVGTRVIVDTMVTKFWFRLRSVELLAGSYS